MCCLLRLRSIGKLKVSMHGPMHFDHSVLSPEGQATHEHLASKRAGPKAAKKDASGPAPPPPQSPPATAAVAATAAAVTATTVAAAPVAPKSSVQQK